VNPDDALANARARLQQLEVSVEQIRRTLAEVTAVFSVFILPIKAVKEALDQVEEEFRQEKKRTTS
jgi:hypothetical protein